jgi:hypothetical protein
MLKIPPIDDAALKTLVAKNPDAEIIEDESIGLFAVVRPPERLEWKTYRTESVEPAVRYTAQMKVCTTIALYPEPADLMALFDRRPAAVETMFAQIAELAGISDKATRRKP